MEYRNTVTFKEVEYLASIKAVSDILTVSLLDPKSSTTWIGTFTSKAIEKLTLKAGGQKPFLVFCKLLYTAIQGKNPSIHLDFYSYKDLEHIRKGSLTSTAFEPSKKMYLIISYITEFDKLHYPLPLIIDGEETRNYETSKPTSDLTAENIRLKQENAALNKSLNSIKEEFFTYKERTDRRIEELLGIKDDLESEIRRMKEELDFIIEQLEEETRKRGNRRSHKEEKGIRSGQNREKGENLLLKEEVNNYRKEIELLRKNDLTNRHMIDSLRKQLENMEEKQIDSPMSAESPAQSPLKYLVTDSHYEVKPDLLSEFSSQLSKMQNLIKKNKS
jgi:coiled-coil domain-containing protein 61